MKCVKFLIVLICAFFMNALAFSEEFSSFESMDMSVEEELDMELDSTNKCTSAKGKCANTNSYTCSVAFNTGLCPGATNIKCCKGTLKVKGGSTNASSSSPSSSSTRVTTGSISGRFPSFRALAKGYPQGDGATIKRAIGGRVNAGWITNTCAVRMSHAFNTAGALVSKQADNNTIKDGKDRNIIFRVRVFNSWINSKFGKPTIVLTSKSTGVDYSALKGKTGLISFTIKFNDATGHLSLWNGSGCVENHVNLATMKKYFARASRVDFWQIK